MSDADAAHEFAIRVAEKWNNQVGNGMQGLVSVIGNELRAGGWCPKPLHLPTPPSNLIYPNPPPGYEAMRASFERNRSD